MQQAGVDAQVNGVNTMLVDRARAPLHPIEPKKPLIVVGGLILGLFAGILAAFVFETNFDGLQDIERIERVTGFPVLATIPPVKPPLRSARRVISPGIDPVRQAIVTLNSPLSQNAEAYRSLRNALLTLRGGSPKTILLTSAVPVNGLAEAAVNLAVSLAQGGSRVLLVDADLRQPILHEMFAVDNNIGLGNALLGDAIGNCHLQPLKEEKNFYLLTSGERPPLPAEQLGLRKVSLSADELDRDLRSRRSEICSAAGRQRCSAISRMGRCHCTGLKVQSDALGRDLESPKDVGSNKRSRCGFVHQ